LRFHAPFESSTHFFDCVLELLSKRGIGLVETEIMMKFIMQTVLAAALSLGVRKVLQNHNSGLKSDFDKQL